MVEEIIFDDKYFEDNLFWCSKVILNLLVSDSYDSSRPWMFKVRNIGKIALHILSYTEYHRATAFSGWEYWLALQWNGKTLSHLGIWAASRKDDL